MALLPVRSPTHADATTRTWNAERMPELQRGPQRGEDSRAASGAGRGKRPPCGYDQVTLAQCDREGPLVSNRENNDAVVIAQSTPQRAAAGRRKTRGSTRDSTVRQVRNTHSRRGVPPHRFQRRFFLYICEPGRSKDTGSKKKRFEDLVGRGSAFGGTDPRFSWRVASPEVVFRARGNVTDGLGYYTLHHSIYQSVSIRHM